VSRVVKLQIAQPHGPNRAWPVPSYRSVTEVVVVLSSGRKSAAVCSGSLLRSLLFLAGGFPDRGRERWKTGIYLVWTGNTIVFEARA